MCAADFRLLQVACEVTNRIHNQIVNIDAADVSDELAVVEYVDDLYKFYLLTEVIFFLPFPLCSPISPPPLSPSLS